MGAGGRPTVCDEPKDCHSPVTVEEQFEPAIPPRIAFRIRFVQPAYRKRYHQPRVWHIDLCSKGPRVVLAVTDRAALTLSMVLKATAGAEWIGVGLNH